MLSKIKYTHLSGTVFIFLLAAFFFIILWINPSFDDKLWPFVVLGTGIAFVSFLAGVFMILFKFFRLIKISITFYFWIGLLNICFSLSGLLILILKDFESNSLFFIIPVFLIGTYIFLDIFIKI